MPHALSSNRASKVAAEWKNDLARDGYAVVKNVISEERAAYYVNQMNHWLEGFGLGYKASDPSTWKPENVPVNMKGGMYHDYTVAHEKFTWESRLEPGVIATFAELWNTPELLVSFDGINLTPPFKHPDTRKWPHIDQAPYRHGMQCVQGILAFSQSGPKDGGLAVLNGSHNFVEEYLKSHDMKNIGSWGIEDHYQFDEEQQRWFAEKGCETIKVCVEPGDLILWDSRLIHYNTPPQGDTVRAIIYVCMTPASFASAEDLKKKKEIFEIWGRTTHWPHKNIWLDLKVPQRNGKDDPLNRTEPVTKPVITEQLLKLAGAMPY
ncbi:hypothetical protein LOCC1_G003793 [Lachnellula occidentalis]|uniref:Phytanoyl-CoA dioxygenase n=1 Tax=Lachnellula occidentalis TaxID=215460 RepID=A0A8H8RWZ1_9HELO|nr:hypothetical protein LOCC1_G003793 [Lachnellula occidentalis]